jgi:hypothetical protein
VPDPPAYDPALTRIQARPENTRHIRHAALMQRWPVLAEPWAQKIAAAHNPQPGAASSSPGRRREAG